MIYYLSLSLLCLSVLNWVNCETTTPCKKIQFKSAPGLQYLWCSSKTPDDVVSSSKYASFSWDDGTKELTVHGSHAKTEIDTIKEGSFDNVGEVLNLTLLAPMNYVDKFSFTGFENVKVLSLQVGTFEKCSLTPMGKSLETIKMNSHFDFKYTANIDKDAFTGMQKLKTIIIHELDNITSLETEEKNVCDHFFCGIPTLKEMSIGVPYTKSKTCEVMKIDGFPYKANLSTYLEADDTPSLSCIVQRHKCHLGDNPFKQKWCGKVDVCHDNFFTVNAGGPSNSGWLYYVLPLIILLLLVAIIGVAYYLYSRSNAGAAPVPTKDPEA